MNDKYFPPKQSWFKRIRCDHIYEHAGFGTNLIGEEAYSYVCLKCGNMMFDRSPPIKRKKEENNL